MSEYWVMNEDSFGVSADLDEAWGNYFNANAYLMEGTPSQNAVIAYMLERMAVVWETPAGMTKFFSTFTGLVFVDGEGNLHHALNSPGFRLVKE